MVTKHVNLRLDPELHHRLVQAAGEDHRSLNGEIEWCIQEQLDARDAARTGREPAQQ